MHTPLVTAQVEAARQLVSATWQQLQQTQVQLVGTSGRPSTDPALAEQHATLTAQLQNAQLGLEALQEAASLYEKAPYVSVWDSHADAGADGLALLCRIDFPPEGGGEGAAAVSSR